MVRIQQAFSRSLLLLIGSFCAGVLAMACFVPQSAWANTAWPTDKAATVSLAYNDTYTYNGKTRTHCGVDIQMKAASTILAPVEGVVSFVGNVPASDNANGKTMKAVSLRLASGRTMTLMPFQTVTVEKGTSVSATQELGTLAPTGDASTSSSHIHIGLKQGETYFDPMEILVAPYASAESNEGSKANETAPVKSGATSSGVASSGAKVGATSASGASTESAAQSRVTSDVLGAAQQAQEQTVLSSKSSVASTSAEADASAGSTSMQAKTAGTQKSQTLAQKLEDAACGAWQAVCAACETVGVHGLIAGMLALLLVLAFAARARLSWNIYAKNVSSSQIKVCALKQRVIDYASYFSLWPKAFAEPKSFSPGEVTT